VKRKPEVLQEAGIVLFDVALVGSRAVVHHDTRSGVQRQPTGAAGVLKVLAQFGIHEPFPHADGRGLGNECQ
jgi:hypothetical protein